jgi:hypothetical protein
MVKQGQGFVFVKVTFCEDWPNRSMRMIQSAKRFDVLCQPFLFILKKNSSAL